MALTQIVYFSRNKAAESGERAQLELLRSVLSSSQRNNARNGITGFLLFDRTRFFQILEGERGPVLATYERIQKDRRHGDVTLMALRDAKSRAFSTWSMGGAVRNIDQDEIFCGTASRAHLTRPGLRLRRSSPSAWTCRITRRRSDCAPPKRRPEPAPPTRSGQAERPRPFRRVSGQPAASSDWTVCTGPESSPFAFTSRSTNSITAIGALSPCRKPAFNTRRYPPGRAL